MYPFIVIRWLCRLSSRSALGEMGLFHTTISSSRYLIGQIGDSPASVSTLSGTLLQRKQLLRAEALIVDLARRLDQVLEMGAGEEVAQVDEFAVSLVLDVDGAPAVLARGDGLAVEGEAVLGADDCEGDDGLISLN